MVGGAWTSWGSFEVQLGGGQDGIAKLVLRALAGMDALGKVGGGECNRLANILSSSSG